MDKINSLRALRARLTYGEKMASSVDPTFADKGKALVSSVTAKIDELLAQHPELKDVKSKASRSSSGTGTRGARGSLGALRAHATRLTARLAKATTGPDKRELQGKLDAVNDDIAKLVEANPGIDQPKQRPATVGQSDTPGEVNREAFVAIHKAKHDRLAKAMARFGIAIPAPGEPVSVDQVADAALALTYKAKPVETKAQPTKGKAEPAAKPAAQKKAA